MQPTPYVEEVLAVVEQIPPGRVLTYGDIAEWIGAGGPRQVGAVMAAYGGGVPWWRVVRADGRPADCHDGEALRRLIGERTPLRPGRERIDLRSARWDGAPAA